MTKKVPFSQQLRAAILGAAESRYRISKATGISESILSRFVRHETGLSMAYTDRLTEHLGLRLVGPTKRKSKQSTRKER